MATSIPFRQILLANAALLVMILAWGGFFPILERILEKWDLYSATVARQILGVAVLSLFLVGERERRPLSQAPWSKVMVLGFVGVSVGSLLTSAGVLLSSGLSAAIISATNPLGSTLTAALLFGEPLNSAAILGTILSVVGGVIAVMGGLSAEHARFQGGELLIIFANVCWTWMSVAAQRWLAGFSQLQITTLTIGSGALGLLALYPLIAAFGLVEIRMDFSPPLLAMLLFAGVVPIAIGNFCWHYGVSRVGVVVAAMYNNLLPAAALVITALLGGPFSYLQIAGTAVIVAGVVVAQLRSIRERRRVG